MAKKTTSAKPAPAKTPAKKASSKAETKPVESRVLVGDLAAANHYGKTPKTIYNWRRDGMPATRLADNQWQYDLDKTDLWVETKQSSGEGDSESAKLKRQLLRARLRKEEAAANQAERDDELAEGNILDRETYELFAAETIQESRDSILRVPGYFSSHLCKKCQSKISELKRQLDAALRSLAKLPDGPTKEE